MSIVRARQWQRVVASAIINLTYYVACAMVIFTLVHIDGGVVMFDVSREAIPSIVATVGAALIVAIVGLLANRRYRKKAK